MSFGEFLQHLAVVLVALAVAEVLRGSWSQPEYEEDEDWLFEETEVVVTWEEPSFEQEQRTITAECQPCKKQKRGMPLLLEERLTNPFRW